MAKGLEKHQERVAAVERLGRAIARRAGSACEMCEAKEELRLFDGASEKQEPTLETTALLCARCRGLAGGGKADPRELRFLEGAVWSEVAVVKRVACEVLARLDAEWAREALEQAQLYAKADEDEDA